MTDDDIALKSREMVDSFLKRSEGNPWMRRGVPLSSC
jgi:hypothetical protein